MMRVNTWRFFFEKSYLLTVSLQNAFVGLITALFGTFLQVFRLQVYRQYWNTGFFKQVHAPTYPLLVEGR